MIVIYRLIKQKLRDILLQTNIGYLFFLKRDNDVKGPNGFPSAPWENSVLRTYEERDSAVAQVLKLELPLFEDHPKNWDSLAALDCILRRTCTTSRILDAGAERYSLILPWLSLYGYKNLVGINLLFKDQIKRGPILYEYGDITRTKFGNSTFDAITSLSVIEHGVDIRSYFKEMSRILKPNGVLVTSTDYYENFIDTKGLEAYGVAVKIFSKEEIMSALDIAREFGLELTGPLDLRSKEKVVHWKKLNLSFTFVIFTLQKRK